MGLEEEDDRRTGEAMTLNTSMQSLHDSGRPRDFFAAVYAGLPTWRVPYALSVPPAFWPWLEQRVGADQIAVYRRDYGNRGAGMRRKGKPPWDQPWGDQPTDAKIERELWERFRKYLPQLDVPGRRVTEYGCMTVPGSMYHLRRHYFPMTGMSDASELTAYPWPDVTEQWRWEGIGQDIRQKIEQGYWVESAIGSIYETAWLCRGQEQLLVDLYENPSFAEALLDRTTADCEYEARRLAEYGVDLLHGGDDMGIQGGLVMSLTMLDKWILSRWEKVIAAARSVNPEIKIRFHTDGKMGAAIPRMLEIGVNAIDPVQPELDDPEQLKRRFGRKLVLAGTVGARTLAFGPPDRIRAEIAERMETAKAYGGMIITSNNSPDRNTPFEHFRAFLEACEEYGALD